MKITKVKTYLCNCFRTNWVFVKIETAGHEKTVSQILETLFTRPHTISANDQFCFKASHTLNTICLEKQSVSQKNVFTSFPGHYCSQFATYLIGHFSVYFGGSPPFTESALVSRPCSWVSSLTGYLVWYLVSWH